MNEYTVTCRWDEEAGVWYVADSNIPGLAYEAETLEAMEHKLQTVIPELLELNKPDHVPGPVPFELIARKQELCA